MRKLVLAMLVLAWGMPARAEPPSPCDRLAGEEHKRCLQLEAQRRLERERLGREADEKARKCDRLFGPEKDLCLKRGGTVRAGKVR